MNADIFQRIRDVISENEPTIILNEIVTEVFFQVNFVCVHLDTMDFSVTGEYKPDFDGSGIQINQDISSTENETSNDLSWESLQTCCEFHFFLRPFQDTNETFLFKIEELKYR